MGQEQKFTGLPPEAVSRMINEEIRPTDSDDPAIFEPTLGVVYLPRSAMREIRLLVEGSSVFAKDEKFPILSPDGNVVVATSSGMDSNTIVDTHPIGDQARVTRLDRIPGIRVERSSETQGHWDVTFKDE